MEIKRYKVSVIIPIYGVEKYIKRCAHSLFKQTLEDIEYIFVNDCTKDNSIKLLQEVINNYPQRKNNIKLIKTPRNNGLPQARKFGLSYATGDYIIHCDSDDWIEFDMYEVLYTKAIQDNLDIVTCDFYLSNSYTNLPIPCEGNFKSNKEYLSDIISQKISNAVWNKLVKRTLYNNPLIHPIQNMGEDLILNVQIILYANKIGHVSKPLYHYFHNPTSITNKKSKQDTIKKWEGINENIQLLENILKEKKILNCYKKEIITLKENCRKFILKPLIYKSEIRNLWLNSFPDINLSLSNSIKNNIMYTLIYFRIYPLLMNLNQIRKRIIDIFSNIFCILFIQMLNIVS